MNRARMTRLVAVMFVLSAAASLTVAVVYALGGQPQLEGLLLGVSLAGLGAGLITWAKAYLPIGGAVQQREPLASSEQKEQAVVDTFEEGTEELGRRNFLLKMAAGAMGALGLAALFPIRSLGGRPGKELVETAWSDGVRLVGPNGRPIADDDVVTGQVLTVFPEGHVGSADSVALLIGLPEGANRPLPGRETWAAPGGLVAYSKLCTHVGCPVGLYEPTAQQLICPCHQSVFDVSSGARPVQGPATRALPQLPLGIDHAGNLIARGGFSEAPGPGFWWRPGSD